MFFKITKLGIVLCRKYFDCASLVVSSRQFLGESFEKSVIEKVLHLAPVGPGLSFLESPVVEEDVVEHGEGVASHVHLVTLRVPCRHVSHVWQCFLKKVVYRVTKLKQQEALSTRRRKALFSRLLLWVLCMVSVFKTSTIIYYMSGSLSCRTRWTSRRRWGSRPWPRRWARIWTDILWRRMRPQSRSLRAKPPIWETNGLGKVPE